VSCSHCNMDTAGQHEATCPVAPLLVPSPHLNEVGTAAAKASLALFEKIGRMLGDREIRVVPISTFLVENLAVRDIDGNLLKLDWMQNADLTWTVQATRVDDVFVQGLRASSRRAAFDQAIEAAAAITRTHTPLAGSQIVDKLIAMRDKASA